MGKLAGTTYGDAWFEYALESGMLQSLYEQTTWVQSVLELHPEFQRLLCSPLVKPDEKKQLLQTVFQSQIHEKLFSFLQLLIDKQRFQNFPEICQHFVMRYKEHHQIGVVSVQSAYPLTQPQKEKLERHLQQTMPYKSLEVSYKVVPELIGGVVIRLNDRVVDGSVRSKLDRLTRRLEELSLGAVQP